MIPSEEGMLDALSRSSIDERRFTGWMSYFNSKGGVMQKNDGLEKIGDRIDVGSSEGTITGRHRRKNGDEDLEVRLDNGTLVYTPSNKPRRNSRGRNAAEGNS